MAFDNWRTGMGWAPDGPRAGYFPFYLSVILGAASLYGLVGVAREPRRRGAKLRHPRPVAPRAAGVRPDLSVLSLHPVAGPLYREPPAGRGLHARSSDASRWWKSLLTSFIFTLAMFITFEVAFDVIMPKGPVEALFGH